MGKRNKERRAAKKRAGRRGAASRTPREDGQQPPHERWPFAGERSPGGAGPGRAPLNTARVAEMLREAALHGASGRDAAGAEYAAWLCGGHGPRARTVESAADLLLRETLGQVFARGWLPVDVHRITWRSVDAHSAELAVDAIAAYVAGYAEVTVPERWAGQLAELDARVWWQRDRPHLSQWAEHTGLDLAAALETVVTVCAHLMRLPGLPMIAPLPGTANRVEHGTGRGMAEKTLARIRGLLAKAEATTYPEEAEALSAKAQELMSRHAFDRAVVERPAEQEQQVTSIRIWLDAPYVDAKASLVHAIAGANRSRAVQYPSLGFVALVGNALDLDMVELLSTSLLLQASRAMLAHGKHTTAGGTSRTRSFRQSFLLAYANRIGQRLNEAESTAETEVDRDRLLPVLAARSRAVEQEFDRMFGDTYTKSTRVSNAHGWHAGRAAADRADLGVDREQLTG
jgi:hypothetical protein